MAVIELTANSDLSSLTYADGDSIDCKGYTLNLDEQPAADISVHVKTALTAGKVTFAAGLWNFSEWIFTAGTAPLIATIPAGCTVGWLRASESEAAGHGAVDNYGTVNRVTGGQVANTVGLIHNYGHVGLAEAGVVAGTQAVNISYADATITTATNLSAPSGFAVIINNGLITTVTAGAGSSFNVVNTNNGTVTNSNGGSGVNAYGVVTNQGYVINANGGSGSGAFGVSVNLGFVQHATGGSNTNAHGINQNFCLTENGSGGSHIAAHGVNVSQGQVFGSIDNVGRGVFQFRGSIKFVIGPDFQGQFASALDVTKIIYSLGPLSNSATVLYGSRVIELVDIADGPTALKLIGRTGLIR